MATIKLLHCYDMSKPPRRPSLLELYIEIQLTVRGAIDYEIMMFRTSRPRDIRTE